MKGFAISKDSIFDVIRTTLIATILSLLFVLIFSLILNFVGMGSGVITGVNQGIKILAILLASFAGIKNPKNGILKGALSGLLFTLFSILIFSIISKKLNINALNLIDVAFGIVAGAISGILAVNLKKKSR